MVLDTDHPTNARRSRPGSNPAIAMITTDQTLADLSVTAAGASRVFHRHGLDFCCNGRISLAEACEKRALDVDALIAELETETASTDDFQRWDEAPITALIDHLLDHFHAAHREEVPRLIAMATKVERVHADKPGCPRGLAAHLESMLASLDEHMNKEEQVLFPLILAGRGRMASMPISCMEDEHRDHGANLERLRALTDGYTAPEHACTTWRALYLGCEQLERDLMEHISLENNVLHPRALRG